jgi:hypothetical protein
LLEPAIRERSFPQRAWLKSIFFAEAPVEIGDVAKSAGQHDIGDFHHIAIYPPRSAVRSSMAVIRLSRAV